MMFKLKEREKIEKELKKGGIAEVVLLKADG